MSDRPYAGLAISMERPQGPVVVSRSNIAGFANFKMSLNNDTFPIHASGQYDIKAIPSDGWFVSSTNAAQTLSFKELKGSPSGLVANRTCDPIGVTPLLKISGSIQISDFASDNLARLFASTSPSGEITEIEIEKDGSYSFPATNGPWVLALESKDSKFTRTVNVGNTPVVVSQINPDMPTKATRASASKLVGFDELTRSDTLYEIPNGYGQLNWTNWIATHQKYYKSYGYINGTVSSEFMAYNSSGHPAEVWLEKPFNFNGVYLSVAWRKAEGANIYINAWRGNKLIYEDKLKATTAGALYFDANYKNVTKIVFSTETYWQLIIDDFSYQIELD